MEIISSRRNYNVRVVRELLKSAEYRRQTDMFAVEGDHLCGELSRCTDIRKKPGKNTPKP